MRLDSISELLRPTVLPPPVDLEWGSTSDTQLTTDTLPSPSYRITSSSSRGTDDVSDDAIVSKRTVNNSQRLKDEDKDEVSACCQLLTPYLLESTAGCLTSLTNQNEQQNCLSAMTANEMVLTPGVSNQDNLCVVSVDNQNTTNCVSVANQNTTNCVSVSNQNTTNCVSVAKQNTTNSNKVGQSKSTTANSRSLMVSLDLLVMKNMESSNGNL